MVKKSFFLTSRNRTVYFEWEHHKNTETLVFLNGLSDSINSWQSVKEYFKDRYSTLLIDLIGQGQSLTEELKSTTSQRLGFKISVEEQAEAVREIWLSLKTDSKFNLVGFSYGGGVAIRAATLFPELVKNLILFLPYTIRLDLAFPIQRFWAGHMGVLKNLNFFKPGMNILGDNYQRMIRDYMNFRFSRHIPDHERRRISLDLTEGIMPFNAFDFFKQLPRKSTHLITVENDTLVPKSLYFETWARLPESAKCSWLNIQDGEHLIFEQAPLYCAQWIETVLGFNTTSPPRLFIGNSYRMETREITDSGHFHSKIS